MLKACFCNREVTKKRSRLFLSLLLVLLTLKGQAQDSASIIVLPTGPLTYAKAFTIIEVELNVSMGHPEKKIPELAENCCAHGQMTFKKFFGPLKAAGITYQFIYSPVDNMMMLVLKRAPHTSRLHENPKSFGVWAVDEAGNPIPNVIVLNLDNGDTAVTDCSGMARFSYNEYPVHLFLTHVSRRSMPLTICKDSTTITLPIDPQSLDEVLVNHGVKRKLVTTASYTTIEHKAVSYDGSYQRPTSISTATVQSMLEGQVPGLLVTQSSGVPGCSDYLSVRGQASVFNGTDPLYIIDGVPASAGNESLSYIQSNSAGGSLSPWGFIAPADIERIDVLRDADATAIYGSRGANGVILITTRHWKAGLPKLEVEFSSGVGEITRRTPFMNTGEYLVLRRDGLQNSGLSANDTTAPDLKVLDTTHNFDWGKWLIGRQAPLANIGLSISGGERRNNYTAAINYLKESTPFPTQPDHDRLTTNFNYNHLSINRRWTLQAAGLGGYDANHQFVSFDPAGFQTTAPDAPPTLDKSGQLNFPPGLLYFNPMSVIRQPYEALSTNYLLSMVNSYAVNEHLRGKATVGLDQVQTHEYGEMPLASQDPASSPTATGYFASTRFDHRVFEPELEYSGRAGKLEANWIAGASFEASMEHAGARTDTGYASDAALAHHDHATPIDTSTAVASDNYTSLYSGLTGNWDDRYILNITARRDGSSRFPTDHRFGNFGAAALAWVFTGGNLPPRWLSGISYGKLKLSEGVTGNNQIGDRTLQNPIAYFQSFQSIPGLYPSTPTATGWEKTYKTELSLDLGFFRNRILFNATAYRHLSDNLLQNGFLASMPSSLSSSNWPVVLQNSGVELSVSASIWDNNSFSWDVSANWTVPKSKLVSFTQLASSPYAGRLVVGQSINVFRGFVYKGVDRETGLYTFADLNNDRRLTDADQKVVGKFDVTGFGGIQNTIRWKQFQIQVLVDARVATGMNYLAAVFANNTPGSINAGLSSNMPKALVDHWRYMGDRASYQKPMAAPDVQTDSALYRYLNSSALLANTSFVRVRHVSIVYTLPPVRALAMGLSSLSIFMEAQDLLVFGPYKGVDPEIQSVGTTPTMKTIELGIRVNR